MDNQIDLLNSEVKLNSSDIENLIKQLESHLMANPMDTILNDEINFLYEIYSEIDNTKREQNSSNSKIDNINKSLIIEEETTDDK